MEMTMDDMNESQAELEYEVTKIFEDLEEGTMLTISQIDTLRYVCGFPENAGLIPFCLLLLTIFLTFLGETMIVTGSNAPKKSSRLHQQAVGLPVYIE